MTTTFLKIALAAVIALAGPASAQQGTPQFRVKIFEGQDGAVPDASTNAGAITYASSLNGKVGVEFSVDPSGSGVEAGSSFAVTSGALPNGLAIDSSNGRIWGNPTSAGTSTDLIVTATGPTTSSASSPFQIAIVSQSLSYPSANAATVGATTSIAPTVTNADSPRFILNGGTLPDGLAVDIDTGAITGSPTQTGTFSGIVVLAFGQDGATSNSNAFTITVSDAQATATAAMATPVSGTVGTTLSATPTSSGFATPPTWTLTSGTLPNGLTLNASSGAVVGAPTTAGTTNGLVLTATSGAQTAQTNAFSIVVAPAPATSSLALSYPAGSTLVRNVAGQTVSANVTGASGPATFSQTSGALPAGMQLDSATGAIHGTPTATGTQSGIVVTATDSQRSTASTAFAITVAAESATAAPNATATVGAPIQSAAPMTNIPGATWALASGTLPTGLSVDSATGAIVGTPTAVTAAGGNAITVRAANGAATATTASFTVTVRTMTVPSGAWTQGTAVNTTVSAPGFGTGGLGGGAGSDITWSVGTGTLPAGLTLDPATGAITGKPTQAGTLPPFTIVGNHPTNGTLTSPPIIPTIAPIVAVNQPPAWRVGGYPAGIAMTVIFAFDGAAANQWQASLVNPEALPPGAYIPAFNNSTRGVGRVYASPWLAGTYPGVTFRVTNTVSGESYDLPPVTFTVLPAEGAPLPMRLFTNHNGSDVYVGARGFQGMTGRYVVDESDPLATWINAGLTSTASRNLYVYPFVVADAEGFPGLMRLADGSDAPLRAWAVEGGRMDPNLRTETNNNGDVWHNPHDSTQYNAFFRMGPVSQTVTGIFPNLRAIVGDHRVGSAAFGTPSPPAATYRSGVIGPFTAKIFDASVANFAAPSSQVPTQVDGSVVLGPGQPGGVSADILYNTDFLGARMRIYCSNGSNFGYSIYAELPDQTWYKIQQGATQPSGGNACGTRGYVDTLTGGADYGVGRRFRVEITSGSLGWRGARIDSNSATKTQ